MDFHNGLVKFLDPAGGLAGSGFIASEAGLVVTCAHVLQDLAEQAAGAPPPEGARLVCQAGDASRQGIVLAQYWRPYPADIAFVILEGGLPPGAQPLPLGAWDGQPCDFWGFGYPALHEPGLGLEGRILARTRLEGQEVLQLECAQVSQGHSGSPVWDGQRVVGMIQYRIASGVDGDNRDTRLAIPSEALAKLYPGLHLVEKASMPADRNPGGPSFGHFQGSYNQGDQTIYYQDRSVHLNGSHNNVVNTGNNSRIQISQTDPQAFAALLEEILALLPAARLAPAELQETEQDLRGVQELAAEDKPNRALILKRLGGLVEFFANSATVAVAAPQLIEMGKRAQEWAQQLF